MPDGTHIREQIFLGFEREMHVLGNQMLSSISMPDGTDGRGSLGLRRSGKPWAPNCNTPAVAERSCLRR